MNVKINLYNDDFTYKPNSEIIIPEDEEFSHINIRPNEIAIITRKINKDNSFEFKTRLYKKIPTVFNEVKLK